MKTQTLDGRYVDKEKLVKLLKELFGVGNFQVKVCRSQSSQESFERPLGTNILVNDRTLMIILSFQRLAHSLK